MSDDAVCINIVTPYTVQFCNPTLAPYSQPRAAVLRSRNDLEVYLWSKNRWVRNGENCHCIFCLFFLDFQGNLVFHWAPLFWLFVREAGDCVVLTLAERCILGRAMVVCDNTCLCDERTMRVVCCKTIDVSS